MPIPQKWKLVLQLGASTTKCKESCASSVYVVRPARSDRDSICTGPKFGYRHFLPGIAGILLDGWAFRLRGANESPPASAKVHPPKVASNEKHTLARSIGWITTEAKVAAEPPHTNGSAVFANPMVIIAFLVRQEWPSEAKGEHSRRSADRTKYRPIFASRTPFALSFVLPFALSKKNKVAPYFYF